MLTTIIALFLIISLMTMISIIVERRMKNKPPYSCNTKINYHNQRSKDFDDDDTLLDELGNLDIDESDLEIMKLALLDMLINEDDN